MAKEIWKLVGLWIQAPSLMPENWRQDTDLQTWFTELVAQTTMSKRQGVSSMVILMIWEIWSERNGRIFRREARSLQQLLHSIQDEARTWAFAGNRELGEILPMPAPQLMHMPSETLL
jgi:hypothetical protein